MFPRVFRLLKNFKPLLAVSLLTTTAFFKNIKLEENTLPPQQPSPQSKQNLFQNIRKMLSKEVCDSSVIHEGQLYFVQVTEQPTDGSEPKTYKIAISRISGKLYAVLAHCTYKQPISNQTIQSNNFTDAISFNDKLYCPHHGCAFDIRTGSVQYGPAMQNLPRFFVQQKANRVKLYYPSKIPTAVDPKIQLRDINDFRKVVIIGGDHHATIGAINGLKQYDYGGQITVIHSTQSDYSLPIRQDLLHRKLLNFHTQISTQPQQKQKVKLYHQLQQKIQQLYTQLKFYHDSWYKMLGIQFIFYNQPYRIINKRFYPYIKFYDSTKQQFDALLIASGFIPQLPAIKGITPTKSEFEISNKFNLPCNVFAPYYNRLQHTKLLKYLNTHPITSVLIFGLNIESLQFVQALLNTFPKTSINIIDTNPQNSLYQQFGPQIGSTILQDYHKKGVQIYGKVQNIAFTWNHLQNIKSNTSPLQINNVNDSIKVRLNEKTLLKADCAVLFPTQSIGNVQRIKSSKYVDIDYTKKTSRIMVNQKSRTDTRRIFAAGSCSSLSLYFMGRNIQIINPNVAYQQGMTSAFNMSAFDIPFHYIPFQTHTFLGKKLLSTGPNYDFEKIYVMGSIQNWDFLALYANQQGILSATASPSKQKQFQIIRQSFRLQCIPSFQQFVSKQQNITTLYKKIRKLNKSGCYKDLIHTLDPMMNVKQVIWMERKNTRSSSMKQDQSDFQLNPQGQPTEL